MSVPLALSPSSPMALGVTSSEPSSWNQQVYQRLKMAIALGLRRQIFLAVCDDKTQGSELAIALQTDADLDQSTCLASIQLLPAQRSVLEQIRQGLPQHRSGTGAVCLQLLGIAELTRQSANLQWSFLRQLREIPQQFLRIESESASECLGSLVFWISRPWLHQIQQSAPEFWRACTGVFEFCSEPFPSSLSSPHSTSAQPRRRTQPASAKPPAVPFPSEGNPNGDRLPPQETVTISPSSTPNWQFVPKSLLQLVTITQDEVAGHHPLERLQQVEQLHRLGGNRDRLGVQYQELGNLYRDRLQRG
ncbi:hypothetical protein [Sodalinema gerasimenkoae]|uniref:hypothetical protein n=1 Tax=Sodalinema gerasimenkoae TaxID=2862348 RepID=UPI00135A673A|nr:hypothetical protein [Sodalinema gerasimenkoae]